jgi:hypothetical protein
LSLREQDRCGPFVVVLTRGTKGMSLIDVIGVRNAAHQDGLMSSDAKVEDGKSATKIKED